MANSFSFEEGAAPAAVGIPETFADRTSKRSNVMESDTDSQKNFNTLGTEFGLTPTSVLRSPQKNKDVGGVANSYHLTGEAADWVVPPAKKAAFSSRAKELGYEVIDEGDHIHIEPPKRGKRVARAVEVTGSSDAGPKPSSGSFTFEEGFDPTLSTTAPKVPAVEAEEGEGILANTGNAIARAATRAWDHVAARMKDRPGEYLGQPVTRHERTPEEIDRYIKENPWAAPKGIHLSRESELAALREQLRFVDVVKESPKETTTQPKSGFWANIENPVKLLTEESLPANIIEILAEPGYVQEGRNFLSARKTIQQEHIVNNPTKYTSAQVKEAQTAVDERASKQDAGVREMWTQLKQAAKEDPGRFGAALVNALVADPQMILVPEGLGVKVIAGTARATRGVEIGSKVLKTVDKIVDAGSTGAALNLGMEAAKAGSEGRDLTTGEAKFAGLTGFTLGAASTLLTRGTVARNKLANREVNADTLTDIMRDVAAEDLLTERVVNNDPSIPPDVKARIEETLGIKNLTEKEKKAWHAKRQRELNQTFADQSLEADYLAFKAEERISRAEQLRQEHGERQAATAAEAQRNADFELARAEDLKQRVARNQADYDKALAQRDQVVQEQQGNAWEQEENLRKISDELDQAEILDAAYEDVPAIKRAMNSAVRRDGNLARPKWQRGEVDPALLAKLGVGGLFAGTAYALAPEDQKLAAAFAGGLSAFVLPKGGRVIDRMRQSGMASIDGDLVGIANLVKRGKLKPDAAEFKIKEAEVVNRAKQGDQAAYKELYDEYFPQIERFVKKYVRDAGPRLGIDAEDVAQEAFVRAFKSLDQFQGNSQFSTWLHSIARNEGLMAIREAQTQRGGGNYDMVSPEKADVVTPYGEKFSNDMFEEGLGSQMEDTPEAHALRQDTEAQLIRAIQKLPERQRETFLLSRVEQFTAQEIADIKKQPLNTVLSDIKRAQDSVMEYLAKDMGAKKEALPETKALADEVSESVKRGRGRPPGKYGPYAKRQAGEVDPRLLRLGGAASLGAAAGFWLNDENRLMGAGIGALGGLVLASKGHKGEVIAKQIVDKADYTLGITSTRIMNKSKEIWRRAIEHERVVLRDTHKYMKQVDPFLLRLNKLPKQTKDLVSRAILTGRGEVTNRLLQAIGDKDLINGWKNTRSALDSLGDQLVALKRFTKGGIEYFPRIVKDVDGLLKAIGKERGSFLQEAIKTADEQAVRRRGTGLTDLEKSMLINKVLADDKRTSNQPGFAKDRGIEEITPELQQYYASPAESLHSYIRSAVEDIERAKFFGQDLKVIKDGNKEFTNVDQSVGNVVNRLINEGKLTPKDAEEVGSLLKSRFTAGERAPAEIIQSAKNLSYAGLLGNPFSAATQLGDAIIQSYTQDIRSAISATVRSLTGRKIVNMKDFGLSDHLAEEFVSTSKTAKALNKIFKYTLFKGVDEFGKDVALNASVIRNSRLARTEGGVQKLISQYGEYLAPGEMEQLIKDLRNGEATDLVKSIAFAELSRTQPISRLELPQAYLDNPNGRLLYQFKTFMLKQIDVARRDGYNEIKKGNIATGIKNLTQLGIALGVAGTTTDKIKDFLLGKDLEFEATDVPMNMLKSYGLTEYFLDNFFGVSKEDAKERRAEGEKTARTTPAKPLESTIGMFAPPAQMFDQIVSGDKKAVRYLPWIGPLLYEQMKSEEK